MNKKDLNKEYRLVKKLVCILFGLEDTYSIEYLRGNLWCVYLSKHTFTYVFVCNKYISVGDAYYHMDDVTEILSLDMDKYNKMVELSKLRWI